MTHPDAVLPSRLGAPQRRELDQSRRPDGASSAGITDRDFVRLRLANGAMGLLHAASAGVMIVLANDFSIEVGSLATQGPPGTPLDDAVVRAVGQFRLAWATAAFSGLSAVFHVALAGPLANAYRRELDACRNRFRWVEYSLSATLMIVLIATISGVVDVAALVGIAGANVAMILFGWVMEVANAAGGAVWWGPFWFGCIAGATPWIAIGCSLAISVDRGADVPTFVWGILASLFVLFNSFAINQWLQYRRIGPWRTHLFGEIVYVVLSLVAKLTLAWQIYANVLVD